MTSIFLLHVLLIILLFSNSIFLFIAESSISSLLFLILIFCNVSTILILFNIDFLALLLIIIYVGAIAILFLFVIMMLNIKIYSFKNFTLIPFFGILSSFIILHLGLFLKKIFFINHSSIFKFNIFFETLLFDELTNIDIFGQVLFNYYSSCFLLAGLILLVAMIGAIVLTSNFQNNRKFALSYRRVIRSSFL